MFRWPRSTRWELHVLVKAFAFCNHDDLCVLSEQAYLTLGCGRETACAGCAGDYLAAFSHVILPIAYEFAPELIVVSAGFDAAAGDPIGGCAQEHGCAQHPTLNMLTYGRWQKALGSHKIVCVKYHKVRCFGPNHCAAQPDAVCGSQCKAPYEYQAHDRNTACSTGTWPTAPRAWRHAGAAWRRRRSGTWRRC